MATEAARARLPRHAPPRRTARARGPLDRPAARRQPVQRAARAARRDRRCTRSSAPGCLPDGAARAVAASGRGASARPGTRRVGSAGHVPGSGGLLHDRPQPGGPRPPSPCRAPRAAARAGGGTPYPRGVRAGLRHGPAPPRRRRGADRPAGGLRVLARRRPRFRRGGQKKGVLVPSPRRSGGRPGAITSSRTPISRTACHGDAPTRGTAPSSICRSPRARCARSSPEPRSTR